MNSRLESRTAKTFGLIAGTTDTTTTSAFSYSSLGEETRRSSSTTATGFPEPQTQSVDSSYDSGGRTKRADSSGDGAPADVDYLYDASGQLIARTANNKTTYLFYFASGASLAEETRPSGATKTRYLNSSTGQILAEQRFGDGIDGEPDQSGSTWVWLLRDPDGNVATELKETAAGTVVAAQRAYDPYGSPDEGGSSKLAGEKESVLGYQCARTDEDTGNILLGARIYDPTTDRFTTSDSFVAAGADLALGTDPLTGNRYVFAAANPVAFYDDGHRPCVGAYSCDGDGEAGGGGATSATAAEHRATQGAETGTATKKVGYSETYDLGAGYPRDLAAFTRGNCAFLFPIQGCRDGFSEGDVLRLIKPFLVGKQSFPVTVTETTPTSFTFEALRGHPEGVGRQITFEFGGAGDGKVALTVEAYGPGSPISTWPGPRHINNFLAKDTWESFAELIQANYSFVLTDGSVPGYQ